MKLTSLPKADEPETKKGGLSATNTVSASRPPPSSAIIANLIFHPISIPLSIHKFHKSPHFIEHPSPSKMGISGEPTGTPDPVDKGFATLNTVR